MAFLLLLLSFPVSDLDLDVQNCTAAARDPASELPCAGSAIGKENSGKEEYVHECQSAGL